MQLTFGDKEFPPVQTKSVRDKGRGAEAFCPKKNISTATKNSVQL